MPQLQRPLSKLPLQPQLRLWTRMTLWTLA
jgi:hypothetical protein